MENKINSGLSLVFIGTVLLLHSLNIIQFNLYATLKYWPLLIILAGVNLIAQNRPYGNYIKLICNALFLSFIFYVGVTSKSSFWDINRLVNIKTEHTNRNDKPKFKEVSFPLNSTEEASLEFDGGEGRFQLASFESEQLIHAKNTSGELDLQSSEEKDGKSKKIHINTHPSGKSNLSNEVYVNLNKKAIWNLKLNFGAAKVDADLSSLKIKNLELHNGASKINIKLPAPSLGISPIHISSGASKIELEIPKDTDLQIKHQSVLSKYNFEGLEQKDDGTSETANYSKATHKYAIKLDGAVSKISISRY